MGKKNRLLKETGTRNVAKHMLLSGICKPLSILISYIYVPIVLNYLGAEKYGVWSTILSILSWISYFDIGIGNGLRNKLTESIAKKETERSRQLVSSAYAITAGIMVVVVIVFGSISSRLNWESVFGVYGFDENLSRIVSISFFFVVVNFVLSICKNILYALQEAALVSIMELGVQIFNLVGVMIASQSVKENLLSMACIYGTSIILVNVICSVALCVKNKDLIPSLSAVNMKVGIDLTSLGVQFFVIQICVLVLFTTDNLIISRLYGAVNVTTYTMVNKLFTVISNVFTALLAPIWSSVTKAKAEYNYDWLKKLINKLNWLMLPFFAGAVLLGIIFRPLSNIWLGQVLDYQDGLIALGVVYCILSIWSNTYAYIANGLELMRMSMTVAITQAGVNIPLSLFFAEMLGMKSTGVLAGTVLSMAIAVVIIPIYVNKYIKAAVSDE